MAETRRPSPRALLVVAALLLSGLEAHLLGETLRGPERLREAFLLSLRPSLVAARSALPSGAAPSALASEARRWGLGDEIEVFDLDGNRLAAEPGPAPVKHWPAAEDLEHLIGGEVTAFGPVAGPRARLLAYVALETPAGARLLRVARATPALAGDLSGRGATLLVHAIVIGVLLLAAALALFPSRAAPDLAVPLALSAYEEALDRLRRRGVELTRRHEAEREELREEIEDLEAMARAGELTSAIIHEVRNGLGTVLAHARLVERGAAASPAIGEATAAIRAECATLENVIRRFMDFVRREALNLAPVDLGRLLARVAARERAARPGSQVTLPGTDAGALVGDEDLLERAFENLVRNACEAAGPGGNVGVAVLDEGDWLRVEVSDDGPGLPAAVRDRLRPFETTKPGGLGLGLPLALKLVRLHGGELRLGERSGGGTLAVVRLPRHGPGTEPGATNSNIRRGPAPESAGR